MQPDQTLIDLDQLYRKDRFALKMQSRIDRSLEAFVRLYVFDYSSKLSEAERKKIAAATAALIKQCREGSADREYGDIAEIVVASDLSRTVWDRLRLGHESAEGERLAGYKSQMEKLARGLPAYAFAKAARGFGDYLFAQIVAEAGDLSDYSSHSKLWKRFGLVPGQNRVPPGLSREDRADAWIANGYVPRRRAVMWNAGESLIKAQVRQVKDADDNDTGERIANGTYGEAYLRRKLHTRQTHPEWWQDKDGNERIDKKTGRPISGHGNNDAHRYIVKRLLRDLWRAWRRASIALAERPGVRMPAASTRKDAA